MNRSQVRPAAAALCAVLGIASLAPALAQDPKSSSKPASAAERAQKADKLLQSYQGYHERVLDDSEQLRKEIERQIKDLEELTRLRFEMTLTAAELRADAPPAQGANPQAGHPQQGSPSPGDTIPRSPLSRELKAVEAQLRTELEQAHALTEKAAAQLRALRGNAGEKHANAAQPAGRPGEPKDQHQDKGAGNAGEKHAANAAQPAGRPGEQKDQHQDKGAGNPSGSKPAPGQQASAKPQGGSPVDNQP